MELKERQGCLNLLHEGKEVNDVKADLAQGRVTDDTFDKTEKIFSEIECFFVEISVKGDVEKECLKEPFRQYEHYRKQMTKLELNVLK